jgi:ferric-dicitrate binding protein FerR (iron transport regulator)
MFSRHVSRQLAALVDGELASRDTQRVEGHMAGCERCREDRDNIRFGMSMLDRLPIAAAPDAIWTSIEATLRQPRPYRSAPPQRWRLALAALALGAVGAAYWMVAHRPGSQWIETGPSSTTTIRVGEIGSVEISPNTRLRIVAAPPGQHRLALARGEIRAKISAPPRLFFVDTPSGTAVDLGCEYTLQTDEDGTGMLQVTRGWVSFQANGLESLIPAGASCQTRPHAGPGIPYFDDAPEKLKQALAVFGTNLDVILAEARVRDTLTLWHLLPRVGLAGRERVYDRIAALTPLPAGVSRQKVLDLDPNTLTLWKDELAWKW